MAAPPSHPVCRKTLRGRQTWRLRSPGHWTMEVARRMKSIITPGPATQYEQHFPSLHVDLAMGTWAVSGDITRQGCGLKRKTTHMTQLRHLHEPDIYPAVFPFKRQQQEHSCSLIPSGTSVILPTPTITHVHIHPYTTVWWTQHCNTWGLRSHTHASLTRPAVCAHHSPTGASMAAGATQHLTHCPWCGTSTG